MAGRLAYRRLFVGALSVASVLAQAATGVNITQSEESRIAVGMDATEVERSLGRPERIFRYPGQPGPTWTYNVVGAPFGITKFDIDFGADGKVASASERIIGTVW